MEFENFRHEIFFEEAILIYKSSISITDLQIKELLKTFHKCGCDILCPVVLNENNEIIFYGSIVNNKKSVVIDKNFIPSIDLAKNYNYVRKSEGFYKNIFVVRKDLKNNLENLTNIKVTPFVIVTDSIPNLVIHPIETGLSIEDKSLKEYIDLNLLYGSVPMRLNPIKIPPQKNILIIEWSVLTPDKDCGSLYMLNFIKMLINAKFNVYFFPVNQLGDDKININLLRQMGVYVEVGCNLSLKMFLEVHCGFFNYISVSRYREMNSYYLEIRKYSHKSKIIYITHDLNFLRIERQEKLNLIITNESVNKQNEINLINQCDISVIVSKYEYEILNSSKKFFFPVCYESIISNNKDSTVKDSNYSTRKGMYFIGSSHPPNLDAINYFLKAVFPLLNEIIPFYIIGTCCNCIDKSLINQKNLFLIPYLSDEDLKTFLETVRINIVPLRYGAGVKGKILQAANSGVCTISTPIGAEGLCFKHAQDIIILEDFYNQATKILEYYNNIEIITTIATQAKITFDEKYSLKTGQKYLKEMFDQVDTNFEKRVAVKNTQNRLAVIFNAYSKPNVIINLKRFLESLSSTIQFDFFLVNNNYQNILVEDSLEYKVIIGDNTTNEFSGIQTAIDQILNKDSYQAFILCNDSIDSNYPLKFIYTITKDMIEDVCKNYIIKAQIDSFNEEFKVDNFNFTNWYRANFIIINYQVFRDVNFKFCNYNENNQNLYIQPKLKEKLQEWLSQDRYKDVADMSKKYRCILNEYRFSYEVNKTLINKNNYIIYILYFDEYTRQEAIKTFGDKPWAKLVFNPTTKYLENYFIINTLMDRENEWKNFGYVGILSWKSPQKIIIPDNFNIHIQNALKNKIDFIYFKYNTNYDYLFERLDSRHGLFSQIWKETLKDKYDESEIFSNDLREFMCNYWITTPNVIRKYIPFLKDVISILDRNPMVERNANYENRPSENYKNCTGKNFYMYHPFILERMICFFVYVNKIKSIPIDRLYNISKIVKYPEYKNNTLVLYFIENFHFSNLKLDSSLDYFFILKGSINEISTEIPKEILNNFPHMFYTSKNNNCYEAWSDVILNIDTQRYDFFVFSTDNYSFDDINKFTHLLMQKLDSNRKLVSISSYSNGFNENYFCIEKASLSILKYSMFHPIIKSSDKNLIIKQTLVELSRKGFDVGFFKLNELEIPYNLLSFNPTWEPFHPHFKFNKNYDNLNIPEHLKEIFKIDEEIGRYLFLYNEGGIFVDQNVECHQPLHIEYKDADIIFYLDNQCEINNSIIISKAKCDFFNFLLQIIFNIIKDGNVIQPKEFVTGNKILSICVRVYLNMQTQEDMLSYEKFYGKNIFENLPLNNREKSKIILVNQYKNPEPIFFYY